jgi:hypothetical protein
MSTTTAEYSVRDSFGLPAVLGKRVRADELMLLVLLGAVLPLGIALQYGAFAIPRNDDWGYLRALFQFSESGTLDMQGWASMALVGQLVLAAPLQVLLPHSIAAAQAFTLAAGVVGLVATFVLGRGLLGGDRGLQIATLVAVGPLWAPLSTSFMTDVPTFAGIMCCLALGSHALRSARHVTVSPAFWTALAVGLSAFTIREYAIAAPIALLAAAFVRERAHPQGLRRLGLALTSLLILAISFWVWRSGLQGANPMTPAAPTSRSTWVSLVSIPGLLFTLSLLLSPIALAHTSETLARAWSRTRLGTALLAGAVLGATSLRLGVWFASGYAKSLFIGNYVSASGTLDNTVLAGQRGLVLPAPVLAALFVASAISLLVLTSAALTASIDFVTGRRHWRRATDAAELSIVVAALVYGLLLCLAVLCNMNVFDRYILPLIPLMAILFLSSTSPRTAARSYPRRGVGILALGALGAVFAVDSACFDGLRWRTAERLAAQFPAARVDGGFEWRGLHAMGHGDTLPEACVTLVSGTTQNALLQASTRSLSRTVTVSAVAGPARCPEFAPDTPADTRHDHRL